MFTKEKTSVCKGIGILFLLFHHLFRVPDMIYNNNVQFTLISVEKINIFATALRVCVWIFAFLSAYGLSYKYMRTPKEKRSSFVPRQWLSLMKPFWLIFLICLGIYVATGHNIMYKYNGNFLFIVFDFFAVADMFGTPKLLGVFWYMFFAQLVVIMLPLIFRICEKLGYVMLPITYITLLFIGQGFTTVNGGPYLEYLLVIIIGVLFAQRDVMNRLAKRKSKAIFKVIMFFVFLLIAAGAMYLREIVIPDDTLHLRGACSAIAATSICVSFGVYFNIKYLDYPLIILGKYSGGMFIIHLMLYSMLPKIVYFSHVPIVVYLTLIVESLAITYLIFSFKKLVRYDKLFDFLSLGINKIPVFLFGKGE
ncbi:MAG: acyltransferase family protein [Ruminococcus sp.]|nr:acyltransferase family protein [Ruminococcus sp.]